MKRIVSIAILACALFSLLAPTALASGADEITPISAEITTVYGDRDGIISMTFDDGYYQTALLLQELFEQYDLYGSIMMTVKVANSTAKTEKWQELFKKGRLEPQNHSLTHMNLSSNDGAENQSEENFKSEILDSKTTLEGMFPEYDIIAYAVPYGRMSDAAMEYAKEYYYAIRYTEPGVQTLDPDFSDNVGSWYKMNSPPVMYEYLRDNPDAQWQMIKTRIDDCIEGWYAPIIHRVGDVKDTDLPLEVAHKMFAYISELNKSGKVWVTTYSSAVKYVRERQNSTVTAWDEDGKIFVRVSMSEYTEDGKPLPLDVFDQPLTVKLEVPGGYESFKYTTGGVEYTATSFIEGGKRYAYVNVIPDGRSVELRLDSTHTFGDWEKHNEDSHKKTCTDCGLVAYGEHTFDAGEVTKPSTHFKEGERTCLCIDCGEDTVIPEPTNNEHIFNRTSINSIYKKDDATCMHAATYYHACGCGEKGTTTFEHGEKLSHSFGDWQITKEPTNDSDGEKARSCIFGCGTAETELIPIIQASDTQTQTPDANLNTTVLIIIIASASVIIFLGMFIILKKKKK